MYIYVYIYTYIYHKLLDYRSEFLEDLGLNADQTV